MRERERESEKQLKPTASNTSSFYRVFGFATRQRTRSIEFCSVLFSYSSLIFSLAHDSFFFFFRGSSFVICCSLFLYLFNSLFFSPFSAPPSLMILFHSTVFQPSRIVYTRGKKAVASRRVCWKPFYGRFSSTFWALCAGQRASSPDVSCRVACPSHVFQPS